MHILEKKVINYSAANAQKTFRDKPDSHLVEGKLNTMHLYNIGYIIIQLLSGTL